MKKQISYAIFTDKGDRELNEDSVGMHAKADSSLFALCDGLGGHGMGDVASRLVIEVLIDAFKKTNKVKTFLREAFPAAQEILMSEQVARNAQRKMKTTAVVAALDKKKVYIGHAGDSRCYVFSKGKVLKRTLDHSIPQMLVLSGEIDDSQIRNHPERNIVLKVMGVEWEEPQYELMKPISLNKCEAFLLCSDGFWELVEETEMCALLEQTSSPEEWVNRMADVARIRGKGREMDNFSAIAIWNR